MLTFIVLFLLLFGRTKAVLFVHCRSSTNRLLQFLWRHRRCELLRIPRLLALLLLQEEIAAVNTRFFGNPWYASHA